MSKHFTREIVAEQAIVVEAPKPRVEVDRTFEMPKALYGATVACYLGFVGIMAIGFSSPGLIIPMAIFAIFIVMGFAVPTIWTRLAPHNAKRTMSVRRLMDRGIATNTGMLKGNEAAIQMLILPVLIVMWGLTTIIIAALV